MGNSKKQKPEWRTIYDNWGGSGMPPQIKIEWCAGCGCLKITRTTGKKTLYRVPRREKERRQGEKDAMAYLNDQFSCDDKTPLGAGFNAETYLADQKENSEAQDD